MAIILSIFLWTIISTGTLRTMWYHSKQMEITRSHAAWQGQPALAVVQKSKWEPTVGNNVCFLARYSCWFSCCWLCYCWELLKPGCSVQHQIARNMFRICSFFEKICLQKKTTVLTLLCAGINRMWKGNVLTPAGDTIRVLLPAVIF